MLNITSKSFFSSDKNSSLTVFKDENEKIFFLISDVEGFLGITGLSNNVRHSSGLKKGIDWDIVEGDRLKKLKELFNCGSIATTVSNHSRYESILYESGFYALCFRSNKPKMVDFRLWVTSKVLPEIRRTGSYSVEDKKQERDIDATKIFPQLKSSHDIALFYGLSGNQAKISASNAVKKICGYNPIDLLEITLVAEVQEQKFTPSDIAKRLNEKFPEQKWTAVKVNNRFEELGLQRSYRNRKNRKKWELSEKAKKEKYAEYEDTQRKNSEGNPILQIKWFEKVFPLFK